VVVGIKSDLLPLAGNGGSSVSLSSPNEAAADTEVEVEEEADADPDQDPFSNLIRLHVSIFFRVKSDDVMRTLSVNLGSRASPRRLGT
jgi:hypothetical protein